MGWKLHRVWTSEVSKLLRWFETKFLALKLKLIKGRRYEMYKLRASLEKHNEESKDDAAEDMADGEM